MDYGKLIRAHQEVLRLLNHPQAHILLSDRTRAALDGIAKNISEGGDFAHSRKLVSYEMVINLEAGERIGRINGKAVLEGFSEDFGWQERMNSEIPLDLDRVDRWLQGWDESSAAAARVLLTTLPVAVELPKAA
jgi:hypothetical protein